MELLGLGLLIAAFALVGRVFVAQKLDFVSAFRALFVGWHADGWPRGVQEEDRDRPWGRPPASAPAGTGGAAGVAEQLRAPRLVAIKPIVRRR
jgi:hypothetical protein